ncbi:SipW-dependent-type signal peptide-containing protein [Streptomyces sp. NPDC057363]|uniref:SipW-dependent-type signal peptide-containing protein n=1 Tax=Streptomyces sp. NPDC057363 TaxID=3346107 RepID=UPI0036302F41
MRSSSSLLAAVGTLALFTSRATTSPAVVPPMLAANSIERYVCSSTSIVGLMPSPLLVSVGHARLAHPETQET